MARGCDILNACGVEYREACRGSYLAGEIQTPEDLTASLAAVYGSATQAPATITVISEGVEEDASVLAQWEDADSLLRLVRIAYRGRIALLLTAKRVAGMAERATVEAKRIEESWPSGAA